MKGVDGKSAPARIGAYRVERPLGRGGMGEVYLAWDERLRRHVALKRIRDGRQDETRRARFRREAQAVARLNHPAVVQIHDVLRTDDGDCLVFEHVEGETVEARLAAGPLAVDEALSLARDVAEGLAEAHEKGLVHRDLKPANVLVATSGRAKVLDFGIALSLDRGHGAGGAGAVVGTPVAMSPEQAAGRPVDHRSDLFALGALLYHMLAGRPPFAGDATRGTVERLLHDEPVSLRELRPEVPAEVEELVRRLLAKPPANRPSDAGEVAAELARLAGSGVPAGGAVPAAVPPADDEPTIYTSGGKAPRRPLASRGAAGGASLRVLVAHGAGEPVDGDLAARFRGADAGGVLDGHGAVLFRRPGDAVGYALACQESGSAAGPRARLAVLLTEVAADGRPPEPAPRRAAALAGLAAPGQVLLGREVFDLARHAAVAGPLASPELRWLSHGSFACNGLDEALEVCEVGLAGRAPLRPPVERADVRRLVAASGTELGWRPAAGQPVPRRPGWELVDKIGDGGFGEVWLAVDPSGEKRAFKFCFETSRVRALKREVTLLRLLKDALGQRDDVARLHGWSFDEAPYFLEMEYSDAGSLADWLAAEGEVPLKTRLELGAEVAEALAAAHSVGVLHKDVKPGNVLVRHGDDGRPHAVLTDFGVGLLSDPGDLRAASFTVLGFTETVTPSSTSAAAGTAGYMAPELLTGQPASVRSDVYALGVVLYQLAVGDFSRSPAPGWRREVADEVLCEDLAAFFDVDPERRPAGALEVAQRLRSLEERRRQREEAAAMRRSLERSQRRWRVAALFGAVAAVLALVVAFFGRRAEDARREAESARRQAENIARATAASHLLARARVRRGSLLLLEVRDPAATPTAVDSLHDAIAAPVETVIVHGHSRAVENAVWSPDGRHFATASHDATARVWTASGESVAVLSGHEDWVWNAAWSPDRRRIATTAYDQTVRLWDPMTGEPLAVLDVLDESVAAVAWSPDASRVLTSFRGGAARIWEAATGASLVRLDGHGDQVVDVAWSGDGTRVATASTDRTARIWEAASGRLLAVLEGHEGPIRRVAWSPDGRLVATAAHDATARTWDARTGECGQVLSGHRGDVLDVDWSPDGGRLLTVSADLTGAIWSAETGERTAVLRGHDDAVWDGAWNAGGTRVVTNGDDKTARVWDPETGSEVAVLGGHEGRVWSAAWSGRRVLTASEDGTARAWEPAAGAPIAEAGVEVATGTAGHNFSWSRSGQVAAVTVDGRLWIWEPPGGQARAFPGRFPSGPWSPALAWSPDATRLATAHEGDNVLWLADGTPLASFRTSNTLGLAWSGDGSRVATATIEAQPEPGSAGIWDARSGENVGTLVLDSGRSIVDVALSPDGTRIAIAADPEETSIRDVATGGMIAELGPHGNRVETVAWSPDGRRVATGGRDREVRVRDVEADRGRLVLSHGDWVWDVAWSPDGRRLLSAAWDHAARVWDAETGALVATFRHEPRKVLAVAWSPDGSRAATVAEDGKLRFWAVPDDPPAYLQARLRARNRSCLEPSVYADNLGLSPREAERRHQACSACVPAFFERVEGVDLWEWPVYVEAWGGYQACFLEWAG